MLTIKLATAADDGWASIVVIWCFTVWNGSETIFSTMAGPPMIGDPSQVSIDEGRYKEERPSRFASKVA